MSNEEIVTLIKSGIDVADNMLKLWNETKSFVYSIAKRYTGLADQEDLVQEGYLALYDAIDGYEIDKGTKFLTYAEFHIRRYMQRYIWMNESGIKMSYHSCELLQQYKKICNSYKLQFGRDPSDYRLSVCMGISEEQVQRIKKYAATERIDSLDSLLSEEDDTTLGDMIPGTENIEDDTVELMAYKQLQETIWPLVDALPGKQAEIIRARYQNGMTLPEIALHVGAEKSEVQCLHSKALRELRKPKTLHKLRPFLPETAESEAYKGHGIGAFNRTWTSSTERVALRLI